MYIPGHFKVDDAAALRSFMESNGFAIVITHFDGSTFASHLPVLFEAGEPLRMVAHMARAIRNRGTLKVARR